MRNSTFIFTVSCNVFTMRKIFFAYTVRKKLPLNSVLKLEAHFIIRFISYLLAYTISLKNLLLKLPFSSVVHIWGNFGAERSLYQSVIRPFHLHFIFIKISAVFSSEKSYYTIKWLLVFFYRSRVLLYVSIFLRKNIHLFGKRMLSSAID